MLLSILHRLILSLFIGFVVGGLLTVSLPVFFLLGSFTDGYMDWCQTLPEPFGFSLWIGSIFGVVCFFVLLIMQFLMWLEKKGS